MFKKNVSMILVLSMLLGISMFNVILGTKVAVAADYTIQQWQVTEISLTSSIIYTDPFQNVDVTATFTGPGATTITRPAFWDGGSTWKIRFAPTLIGLWTMTTSSTDTTNTGLHNITKTVQSDAYTGSLDIYKKGFLKIHNSGRYFTYADGTPFFYLGDTHWIMPHERWATSNVTGVASQFKYTVDKRVSQGFTVYQSEPIWQPHGGGTHSGADEEVVANLSDGFTGADLGGFANLDRKFKYIADLGMVHANAQVTWAQDPANYAVYTDAYMTRVAKYWVARYGAYPVIWTIAQEIDKNMYGAYNSTTISKWYSVGQSLSDNDAYNHPLLPHMENTGAVSPSTSWWSNKPYHDGWAVQWGGEMTGMATATGFWNSTPAKPSVMYESYYDQFWTDSRGALGAGYKSFQYGIYGYGYGAAGVWNDIYSKPGDPDDFGTAYEIPLNYYWWYDGANLQTGNQLTYLKNFYVSNEWWKLIPRFDNATWGSFTDTSRSLLSSDGQNTYVVFFFGSGTSTGTLKNMTTSAYDAKWFNPRNGSYTNIGSITSTGSQWTIPNRPTAEDWVLLVKQPGVVDTTAPSAVSNLSVSSSTTSMATVNWTSPGDDGSTGTATSYDIRYSTAAITDANWASATQAAGEPAPLVAGTSQSFTVTGLSTSTTYYFAIKTLDEVPNVSGLSNVPSGTTTAASSNLALGKTYSASSVWDSSQTADKAFDGLTSTNWQAVSGGGFAGQWLEVNFGAGTTFNKAVLSEYGSRTTGFRIEVWNGTVWATAYTGTAIGSIAAPSTHAFTAVTGSKARIYYTSGTVYPIMYEFEIYNQGTGDTTAPSAVTNLTAGSLTSNSAALSWTAPGDDGSTGTAVSYDIRYSTAAITDANWTSATQATGEPAPLVAGTSQSFTVTGLGASTTYYFAIKTSDEVPNVSSLSNVPSGTTTAGSSNLALGKTYSASSVWDASQTADKAFDGLTSTNWQAVNGGGFAGQWLEVNFGAGTTFNKAVLSEYGSRTTGFRIEVWNGTVWATAYTGTAIGSIATPSTHAFTAVTGSKARIYYTSGTEYSPIMYEFEIYNQGTGDTTAPSAVTNLSAGSLTSNSAALSWTAPGDDGSTGTAVSYDIRYSTAAITDANWTSATQATGEPAPLVAGTSQSFTVTGLGASTTYYFAIKTSDEVPNVSGLSNVPSGTTADPNLVGEWKLNETSGISTSDTSGNGNTGTLNGGATWVTGKSGNAVNLDGVDDYVNIPDASALDGMSALTVAAWVNLSQLPTQNYVPIGKDSDSGSSYRIVIGSNGTGHFVVATANNSWYSVGTTASFTSALSTNTWYHIVGTYDGTIVKVYVNGVWQGTGVQSISGSIVNNAVALKLGYKSSSNIDYTKGKVDEARIYNRALNATEVTSLYNSY